MHAVIKASICEHDYQQMSLKEKEIYEWQLVPQGSLVYWSMCMYLKIFCEISTYSYQILNEFHSPSLCIIMHHSFILGSSTKNKLPWSLLLHCILFGDLGVTLIITLK